MVADAAAIAAVGGSTIRRLKNATGRSGGSARFLFGSPRNSSGARSAGNHAGILDGRARSPIRRSLACGTVSP